MSLSPEVLDQFAIDYYLNSSVPDLNIEALHQQMSVPRIIQSLGGARRVLDLGFGTGLMAGALLDLDVDLEVVEGASSLCDEAARRYPQLTVHRSMFEDFQPDSPYDAVLALHVMEHVDDSPAALRQIASWLKPNGSLIVVVPNRESIHRNLAVRMGLQQHLDSLSARDHLVGHRRVYDFTSLEADLAEAGLEVDDRFGTFFKPLPNSMMLDFSQELLIALNSIAEDLPPHLLANIGVRGRKHDS